MQRRHSQNVAGSRHYIVSVVKKVIEIFVYGREICVCCLLCLILLQPYAPLIKYCQGYIPGKLLCSVVLFLYRHIKG